MPEVPRRLVRYQSIAPAHFRNSAEFSNRKGHERKTLLRGSVLGDPLSGKWIQIFVGSLRPIRVLLYRVIDQTARQESSRRLRLSASRSGIISACIAGSSKPWEILWIVSCNSFVTLHTCAPSAVFSAGVFISTAPLFGHCELD
jgi:hypothetical protein